MRIKIKTPNQYEYTNMRIVFGVTAVLFIAWVIFLYTSSNGQLAVAVRTVQDLLNVVKQDDFSAYLAILFLLLCITVGPFASGAAIFYYARKRKQEDTFTALNFDDAGLTLESNTPERSVFTPYKELGCLLCVSTYIRRGPKGAAHRCIDHIRLVFFTPQGEIAIKHVGAMDFIRQILDVAGKFNYFRHDVHALNGEFNDEERDLVQYVKEQIHNYRTYGKMLRYSNSQRRQVGWMGCTFIGLSGFLLLGSWDLFRASWQYAQEKHDIFSLAAPLLLAGVGAGMVTMGVRMCYLAYRDAKLAKQLAQTPRN